jgi:type IV pilus assembly protein PilY1
MPMKTVLLPRIRMTLLLLVVGMVTASADDSEIFTSSTGSSTGGPNILFIVDTSGSMGSTVYSQAVYDPTVNYATVANANCTFDNGKVYFSTQSVPNCGSTNAVPRALFNCPAWASAIDGSPGTAIDAAVAWTSTSYQSGSTLLDYWIGLATSYGDGNDNNGQQNGQQSGQQNSNPSYQWSSRFSRSSSPPLMIVCQADYTARTGPYPTSAPSTSATPQYAASAAASWWGVSGNTPATYNFYSGNYLNYYYSTSSTVQGTRLSVVQQAATNLVNSMTNVNIGLMRYSDNSSNTSPCINQSNLPYNDSGDCTAQGGMVTFPITPIATGKSGFLSTLNGYAANGSTPLSETMYEAYQYFSGGSVTFGDSSYTPGSSGGTFSGTLTQGSSTISTASIPSGLTVGASLSDRNGAIPYNTTVTSIGSNSITMSKQANTTVSTAETITYSTYSTFSPSVASSRVGGTLSSHTYQSPIQYSCQKNFIVFLTDGLPTEDNEADTLITGLPNEATLGGSCDNTSQAPYTSTQWGPSATAGKCLSALTKYMFNTDMSSALPGQQNVQTYFIGFGNDPQLAAAFSYLQSAASKGGGQAYTAGDLSSLQSVLTSITSNILQISTTFTAPTVAVNAFNRTQTLNDLYVSVFQPSDTYHWPGNLKHYLLSNGVIVDANGQPAVDPATGFFKSSAQSLWSPTIDGTSIPTGGAANLIPDWNPADTPHRNVYTYVGTNKPTAPVTLTASPNTLVTTTNPLLTNTLLGAASQAAHDAIINYARGEDLRDENDNQSTIDTRHTMGDPTHAQPAAVIYGGTPAAPDPTDGVIYVAENDGLLHAIATSTGVELWSFVPQEVLPTLGLLYQNAAQPSKHYTLDGSVRVLKYDANNDGVVDPSAGDRVFIYFGQGRGGSTYYALDVTDRNNPKFMWSLSPSDLPGLGYAWSTPQIARVQVGGGVQTSKQSLVLAIAGGYDLTEETPTYATSDGTGNALYLVDAVAGTVLWSGGGTGLKTSTNFARMDHAIPSDIAILDTNGDGYADRMYVGDMAGQVWRFDITNGAPASSLVTGGVIASLGAHDLTSPGIADTRRFYNAPDVSVVQKRGQSPYMNIAIGSGYRGHPLNTAIQDRMYAIRDYTPFAPLTSAQYSSLVPLRDADLTDITNSVAPALPANARGWKLLLDVPGGWLGEKVLSPATTLNNQILFTTYTPGGGGAVACQPVLGTNRFYAVSVVDGSPVANLNNQNNTAIGDRSTTLAQSGIAPNIAFLFPAPVPATDGSGHTIPSSTQSQVLCMSGAEILGSCKTFSSRVKTYWKETDAP